MIHGVFMRTGGYSAPPYQGLNTIKRGDDSTENVIRNRQLALQTLGLAHQPTITLWQVHGADVIPFYAHDEWRTDWAAHSYFEQPWTPTVIRKGDALITQERGTTLALSRSEEHTSELQ